MVENKPHQKGNNDRANALKEQLEEAKLESPASSSEASMQDIYAQLAEEEGFFQDIEHILSAINDNDVNLSSLQAQILALIKKYLARVLDGKLGDKYREKHAELLKIDDTRLNGDLLELSKYIIEQKKPLIKQEKQEVIDGKYESASIQSKKDLGRIIKNLAVYEIYKCMNPNRLAGETKKDNFIHNVIIRGAKYAMQKASKAELKNYSPSFIKSLEKDHTKFKSQNRTLGLGR